MTNKITSIQVNRANKGQPTDLLEGLVTDGNMPPMVRVGLEALAINTRNEQPKIDDLHDRVITAFQRFRAPGDRQAIILVGMHLACMIGGSQAASLLAQSIGKIVC